MNKILRKANLHRHHTYIFSIQSSEKSITTRPPSTQWQTPSTPAMLWTQTEDHSWRDPFSLS